MKDTFKYTMKSYILQYKFLFLSTLKSLMKSLGLTICPLPTFQVQVLGPIDTLNSGCVIYFQCVGVAVVSGDGHIVPLVVI